MAKPRRAQWRIRHRPMEPRNGDRLLAVAFLMRRAAPAEDAEFPSDLQRSSYPCALHGHAFPESCLSGRAR